MSRETFQAPQIPISTNNESGVSAGAASQAASGFAPGASISASDAKPVQYLCGDCDTKVVLRVGEPIRCKECGYRVLYKERTNR